MATHQSKASQKLGDGNSSSEDNKKVSSGEHKIELKKMMIDFMEQYTRPTSKIVAKESSASDVLALGTAASKAESEIKRKCRREFDTQLRSVIRDKMYTRMKFKFKKMALYVAQLGLDTGYM